MPEPIAGLYEQLLTVELRRLLTALGPGRAEVGSPDPGDAHTAAAEYMRRLPERTLDAVPEDERLTRQAEICNALLGVSVDHLGAIVHRSTLLQSPGYRHARASLSCDTANTRTEGRLPTRVSAPRTTSHTNEAVRLRSPGACVGRCRTISSAKPRWRQASPTPRVAHTVRER